MANCRIFTHSERFQCARLKTVEELRIIPDRLERTNHFSEVGKLACNSVLVAEGVVAVSSFE